MQEGDKTTTIVCGECDQNPCVCPWDNPVVEGAEPIRIRPPEGAEKPRLETVDPLCPPEEEQRPAGFGAEGRNLPFDAYVTGRAVQELQIHVRNHELSLLGIKEQLVALVKTQTDILEHLEALDKGKVDLADFEDHKKPTTHPY